MRLLAICALALAACSFSGKVDAANTADAAATVDAAAAIDAAFQPCAGILDGIPCEGGNVIVESLRFSDGAAALHGVPTGTTQLRALAYFLGDMTPESNPLSTPGECVNLRVTGDWPTGQGTAQVYLDVGDLAIRGRNAAAAPTTITLTTTAGGTDDLARLHTGVFYQELAPVAADLVAPDEPYEVSLGGSVTFATNSYPAGVYLPVPFAPIAPAFDDTAVLTAGTDLATTWTPPDPAASPNLAAGDVVVAVTWLVEPTTFTPILYCVTPASVGNLTISGVSIQSYRDSATALAGGNPNQAILVRQHLVQHIRPLGNGPSGAVDPSNQRRVDFLGMNSLAQQVTVNP